ncbi:MAG: HWE histidine kinase domain-containing protein [Pseudomonadota bacterium]
MMKPENSNLDKTWELEDILSSSNILRGILDNSDECIKVLDFEGRVQFMNLGGQKVMEVDDFATIASCPWIGFWNGPYEHLAQQAISEAQAGRTGIFEGECPTAKGTKKWWSVRVSQFKGENGKNYLLSISRDVTLVKQAHEQMALIQQELQHRIKNMYSVVQSVASNTMRNATSLEDAGDTLSARLIALSKSHALLTTDNEAADINNVIEAAITPCADKRKKRVLLNGPSIQLASKPALALGMALHELCTNAIKYGALSNESGIISVNWDVVEDATGSHLKLHWEENGGPIVNAPKQKGFGSLLIQRALATQVEGDVDLDFATAGVTFKFKAPLANMQAIIALN